MSNFTALLRLRHLCFLIVGHVGNYDVADCMKALEAAVKCKDWNCDPDKVGVMGGSHGGFLSLHLIGQHPEVFKVCVARNPVTNIGSMASLTDIPDWCYYEVTTETYDRYSIFEVFVQMGEKSLFCFEIFTTNLFFG